MDQERDRKRGIVMGHKSPAKKELARQMRRALTPQEAIIWQRVRNNQLGGLQIHKQQVIDGFLVDFYCHAAGLVIEIDGGIHETTKEYDAERDRILARRGLEIIRFTNAQVETNVRAVLQAILEAATNRINESRIDTPSRPGRGPGGWANPATLVLPFVSARRRIKRGHLYR